MMEFNIFGDIIASEADRWDDSEVTPAQVSDFLQQANGPVQFNVNSAGGSVTGGLAIANLIRTYPFETTCVVDGIAASIASVIACAATHTKMAGGSFLLIHNPWTRTTGTAEDLRKDADNLDKMRDAIISFYRTKCTKTEDELKQLMDAETWIVAEEAKNYGFDFEVVPTEMKAAASLTRAGFDNAPDAAKAMLRIRAEKPVQAASVEDKATVPPVAEKPAAKPSDAPVATQDKPVQPDNWEARFKGLSTKYNELKTQYDEAESKHVSEIMALSEERDALKNDLAKCSQDLADAQAKVSSLTAQNEEDAKALQQAHADLATMGDKLASAEEQVQRLTDTRDMLTAGVLTPPSEMSYAAKMKAAKPPEARESLRAQKRAGKIK